ncbi:GNAT family N-acetyltransferase [Dactylosporangium sp. NPDC048998]|uniref:GNAT family N-acetyltransferase n=1 Tax=Dactylosporangium sp. NPDC048998 TaxID=3363976 RepID=UPI003718E55A
MRIEPATPADAPSIARISRAAGQPDTDSGADPAYLAYLLGNGTVRVARDDDGAVAGWGATTTGALGNMLSDLFVDPARHGRGVGARLLRALWPDPAAGRRFTFSSRHPAALPLYLRAGLRPAWPLLYLRGPAPAAADSSLTVTPVDAATATAADRRLTGAGPAGIYAYRPGDGLLVHHGTRPVAAGTAGRSGLTHLTCPAGEDATAILRAVLHGLGAAEVSLCLPGPHPAVAWLLGAGFRIEDHDLAMHTPDVEPPTTWVYSPGLG